ncbi:MAG: hypothetical protein M3Q97_06110 [Bacteroidota bacterium]|nr:hypothetical protein [Bacteroidota bacterium]
MRNILLCLVMLAASVFFFACEKEDIKPVLAVNVLGSEHAANELVPLDINATIAGGPKLTNLKVVSTFRGIAKTEYDSTITPPVGSFTRVVNYRIPADALTGEKITMSVTLTADNGQSVTSTKVIEVFVAKPRISVVGLSDSLAAGSERSLKIYAVTATKSINLLSIYEKKDGAAEILLDDQPYNNVDSVTWFYTYTVPMAPVDTKYQLRFVATDTLGNFGEQRHTYFTR